MKPGPPELQAPLDPATPPRTVESMRSGHCSVFLSFGGLLEVLYRPTVTDLRLSDLLCFFKLRSYIKRHMFLFSNCKQKEIHTLKGLCLRNGVTEGDIEAAQPKRRREFIKIIHNE